MAINKVPSTKGKIALNNVIWGVTLWLFGYILGFIFYYIVPPESIGWYIMPLGLLATLWVLIKKIHRAEFSCFIGVGVFWLVIAVVLDRIFLVNLLEATDYYKLDVYIYYTLTLLLPIIVGWFKMKSSRNIVETPEN